MGYSTDIAKSFAFFDFGDDVLKQCFIRIDNILLGYFFPFPLDDNSFLGELFQRDLFVPHDAPDYIVLVAIFSVCEHWDIFLHAPYYPHVHATHVLLQRLGLRRNVGLALACYRLATSQLGTKHAHVQQLRNHLVVFHEG